MKPFKERTQEEASDWDDESTPILLCFHFYIWHLQESIVTRFQVC